MSFFDAEARILTVYQTQWLWRHHLVTTRIGKSLVKMNQWTINALIAFLVWIVFFHSSSCNAFVLGVQVFCSPKTPSKINNALSFGGKSNKSFDNETVSSFQLVVASVATKFLKGSTSNSPAFEQLPVPNDHSTAFKQLSVSNDGRAITALSFLHLHIPFRMATHANHSSVLNPATLGLQLTPIFQHLPPTCTGMTV